MSTTVDSRVVEMSFDNKNFESNVQTSLGTLEKLKQSLNLNGSAKGLENIDAAAKKVNIGMLGDAVETVKHKFSAFEVIAITALVNITNSVVNTGKQMLRSLSLDPIMDGFKEYELKMDSVQTIMAGTGAPLEKVMDKLNELNTYADKTIYSFADMTTNIGKFTNAGVSLDDSVKAIQGVANVAAVSGANAQEASRAMYNFAQALSAGYVKLIDWKSIENANMATVEFKTQLLESAVAAGKLEKTADGMYKVLTTNIQGSTMDDLINATHNFNDSLSYQWMTTDVLTKTLGDYADETTEIGKKAFAAAQDVKTFTQLMNTLKEAVGSGWAETWEIVFGNFDEAKALWTEVSNVVGGFIDAQSKARNTMLQEWKDLGGRTDLIEALKNAISGIASVVKPAAQAFREIFPPITGKQLADFTAKLKELTAKMTVSEETAEKIKNVFKGFFAILDIGKQAITAIKIGVVNLGSSILNAISPIGGGVLGVTYSFAEFLTKLDETIKKTGIFQKAVDTAVQFLLSIPGKINSIFKSITGISIGDAFSNVTEAISGALEKIKGFFEQFGEVDTSGIDKLTNKVSTRFQPLTTLFNGIKSVFSGLWEFLKKLSPIFLGLATAIGRALDKVGSAISDGISTADFDSLLDLVNGGVLVAIGVGIKKFMDGLGSITENAGGMLGSIKDILDGVKGCFEAWQKDIQANTLIKIAVAIGIISASLIALSLVDSQKLTTALTAMTTEFIELITAFKMVSKIDASETGKAATTMILMSGAILLLTSACKSLAKLDWDGIFKGLVGIAGLSEILVLSAKQLSSNSEKMMKGATGLIAFAIAIKLLVEPTKELGAISVEQLGKGLISVGVLCAELAAFLKVADLDNTGLGKGLGLMTLAEAINILANAVGKFAGMDTKGMIQGLTAVGVVLTELGVFTKLTGNASGVITTSTGMVVLGAAMLIFGEAVEKFGSMDLATLAKGLTAMAGALTIAGVAIKLIPNNAIVIGAGLVAVGAALNIIASATQSFGNMSWEEIGKGLLVMAGALAELVIALNLMTGTLSGSAALLVAAGALAILCPVLSKLGKMPLKEIGKALLTLAGVFTVIGVAGLLLAPIVPAILGLSGAVALLGVGALACGAGVLALSAGLSALAISGTAGITALILGIEAFVSLIPEISIKVGEGLIALFETIGNSADTICQTVIQLGIAIITSLDALIPQLLTLIANILAALVENLPSIIQSVMDMLIELLEGIRNNISPVVTIVVDTIIQILEAITAKIPDIIQAGIDVVIGLIDGLSKGLVDNAPRIRDALLNLMLSLLEAVLAFFGIHSPSTVFADIGLNLILGLIEGIWNMLSSLLSCIISVFTSVISGIGSFMGNALEKGKELMKNIKDGILKVASSVVDGAKTVISDCVSAIGDKAGEFLSKGKELMYKVRNGISSKIDDVVDAAKSIIKKALDAVKGFISKFTDVGKDIIDGLKDGISSAAKGVVNTAKDVAKGALDGAKSLLGIHSPSKEFAKVGRFSDEGMAQGLNQYAGLVADASANVGETAVDSMSKAISGIADRLDSEMETDPTIRPVLDLSDITDGVSQIDDMLYSQRSMQLASSIDIGNSSNNGIIQNATKSMTEGLADEFDNLRSDVSDLANAISNMKIVMDTGTVVGALVTDMDEALGNRAVMVGRSV